MTFNDFLERFPDNRACVDYFLRIRYGGRIICHHCGTDKFYHRRKDFKNYHCPDCNNTFSVFKATIFENSSTSLTKWMYAIHLLLNGKKGISGLQLQREIGVTYKTAWRILQQIRKAMSDEDFIPIFTGTVEMDETYIAGKVRDNNNRRLSKELKKSGKEAGKKRAVGRKKMAVIGVIQRGGNVIARSVDTSKPMEDKVLLSLLKATTLKGSTLVTDGHMGYRGAKDMGYEHFYIDHTLFYFKEGIHNNTLESFWSTLKRGIYGIYHSIDPKYLENYVNEFCFRYNNRKNKNVFDLVLIQSVIV